MNPLPSKIEFASLLKFSRGRSDVSQKSYDWAYKVKHNLYQGSTNAIDHSVSTIQKSSSEYPFLNRYLNSETLLVPVPGHAPRVIHNGQPGLWVPLIICEKLVSKGLGQGVAELIKRSNPVPQSSRVASKDRPTVQIHYDSFEVSQGRSLEEIRYITLVDDVVTQGATFLAAHARLRENFPNAQILCFGLMRSMQSLELREMLEPVEGEISYRKKRFFGGWYCHREP